MTWMAAALLALGGCAPSTRGNPTGAAGSRGNKNNKSPFGDYQRPAKAGLQLS